MVKAKKEEVELSIVEGEALEPRINEGEVLKDVQSQKEPKKDTELLQSINQKLDILLAAQNLDLTI